ncbi:MAG: amidohydrolase [Gemmatimonadetes bacterium]|nr:amidohydrolase [Gemmatimonadota bacterium]
MPNEIVDGARRVALASVVLATLIAATGAPATAQGAAPNASQGARLDSELARVVEKVIAWRRDIHQNPELGNAEVRTAKLVADHMRSLGIEVREKVGKTGVVGVLRGGRPGPVVALRADMDALPVTEEVDLPFKSTVRTTFNGQNVGVMHACGHDAHTAMLLGAADVLAKMKPDIAGTIVFIFQPAEEGPPAGETGGAPLMVAEGALDNPKPEVIFGLHVWPDTAGRITYRPRGAMSASDGLDIVVRGRQTHGAVPWRGVDPIVVASQIITALQTIPARQTDVTVGPAVVTIGMVSGGVRRNIIPDSVVMQGTIRTFDSEMRKEVLARVKRTAENIAEASGATATVTIPISTDVVFNDPALTARMTATLERVSTTKPNPNGLWMPSEDFPAFTKNIPGLYVFMGINARGVTAEDAAANHSPKFFVNEDALPTGVKTYVSLALDYLRAPAGRVP